MEVTAPQSYKDLVTIRLFMETLKRSQLRGKDHILESVLSKNKSRPTQSKDELPVNFLLKQTEHSLREEQNLDSPLQTYLQMSAKKSVY